MAYTAHTWKDGEVITAADMNHLEQGVLNEQVGPVGPPGADGKDGSPGPQGTPGAGVPAGGSTGQMLVKASDADFDTKWAYSTVSPDDTYSTNETKTGATWVDGNPIYRVVVSGTSQTSTGTFSTIKTVQNVSAIVRITWVIGNSFDNYRCGQDRESIVGYNFSTKSLGLYLAAGNRGGQPYTVIFEYTKTTD